LRVPRNRKWSAIQLGPASGPIRPSYITCAAVSARTRMGRSVRFSDLTPTFQLALTPIGIGRWCRREEYPPPVKDHRRTLRHQCYPTQARSLGRRRNPASAHPQPTLFLHRKDNDNEIRAYFVTASDL